MSRRIMLAIAALTAVNCVPGFAGTHVYVAVGDEKRIAHYRADGDNGSLQFVDSLAVDGAPGSLAVDARNQHMYIALRSTKAVGTAAISPSGQLEVKAVTPVGFNPVYVTADPTNRWLLTSSYSDGLFAVYPIRADGTVANEASESKMAEKNPHSIQLDPTGKYVYVPNTGADSILQLRFDATTGQTIPLEPAKVVTAKSSGPRHFTFHPKLSVVYFVNEINSTVSAYKKSPTGQLDHQQTLSTLPADYKGKNTCADIHITPNGRWLYASNRGHDSIACYEVDSAMGQLRFLGTAATEKTPREFAIDPAGSYLYSAGQGSGKLIYYRIEPNSGELTPQATYDVGKSPARVTVIDLPGE